MPPRDHRRVSHPHRKSRIIVPTVVIAGPPQLLERMFPPTQWNRLTSAASVLTLDGIGEPWGETASSALAAADVLVTARGAGQVGRAVLDVAQRLRGVVHVGASVRAAVAPEAYRRGVVVASQAAFHTQPIAEYAVAMIILAAKDVLLSADVYRAERAGIDREERFPHAGLFRRRVGIIGLSQVSRRVVELLRRFDLDVYLCSRHLDVAEAAKLGVTPAALDEIFAECEVISLHSADTADNRHMIGRRQLRLITPGAKLIDADHGHLVDRDALVEELAANRFGAVIDVADPNALPPDSPLWRMPNVLITPHCAGAAGPELEQLGDAAVRDVLDILDGRVPAGLVGEPNLMRA
jgi:phosphoglycerate dehydrogenase-like enzyme